MMTLLFDQEYARRMEILAERQEAEAIGEARGEARGIVRGMTRGADNLSDLLQKLYAVGKSDDAQKVIYDPAFRSQKMAEYGFAQ